MEKIDILLWVVGVGFTFNFALMRLFWNAINSKFDKLDQRFDKLDEKVTDIDRRLCRLEGAFTAKECCRIQDEKHFKQAE